MVEHMPSFFRSDKDIAHRLKYLKNCWTAAKNEIRTASGLEADVDGPATTRFLYFKACNDLFYRG
jgi:hypothetical protein